MDEFEDALGQAERHVPKAEERVARQVVIARGMFPVAARRGKP